MQHCLPMEKGGLTANGLVYRYNIKEAGDGLSGEEGTQYLHVWLVEALTRASRHDRSRLEEARLIFERRSALPTMLASTRKTPGIAATPWETSRKLSRTSPWSAPRYCSWNSGGACACADAHSHLSGMTISRSLVSTTKRARSLAGSVLLALWLTW